MSNIKFDLEVCSNGYLVSIRSPEEGAEPAAVDTYVYPDLKGAFQLIASFVDPNKQVIVKNRPNRG